MNVLVRKLNSAYYRYRANQWRWHPRFRRDDTSTPVDRPIFLLGTQGGGLTLTTRILRRHPDVVSVAGDCRNWAGPDEMHQIMPDVLPSVLGWPPVTLGKYRSGLNSWLYACDDLLPHYRQDESAATPEVAEEVRSVFRRAIRMSTPPGRRGVRFLDMSQTNTIRVGLLDAALSEFDPKFVLLVRNPFAMCWRAVHKVRDVVELEMSEKEKFDIAVQHWTNSMNEALAYEGRADLATWRFEDLLAKPEHILEEICEFVGLPYRPQILPTATDRIPFGSASDAFDRSKWYPLRPDLNERYLQDIPEWAVEIILRRCAPLLERFDYRAP